MYLDMTWILELFKITMINMLRALLEKIDYVQEETHNISGEMETLFDWQRKESLSLKRCQLKLPN